MVTILLIDDDPGIRTITRIMLRDAGFEVVEAEDGETGLEILKEMVPDLILCDVMMPGISGWELCDIVKNNKKLRDIPLAIFTVKDSNDDMKNSLLCDADMHITKPFDENTLIDNINALLEINEAI